MLRTETRNPRSMDLGQLSAAGVVQLMDAEESLVLSALRQAAPSISAAAARVAQTFLAGGRIFMLGAGTSGRLVAMEAAELAPTFGLDIDRFVPLIACGGGAGSAAITASEDDEDAAPAAMATMGCADSDGVIGVAASGTTPFVLAGMGYARTQGAWTCGMANNPGTPLLAEVDIAVLLDTGPELLTGSTRMKAGTSQKLALNRITTAAMVVAGRIVSNLMVEVKPSTVKLRQRCVRIVSELARTTETSSTELLEATSWDIRAAVALGNPQPPGQPPSG